MVLAWAAWRSMPWLDRTGSLPPAVTTVDPNVAPWWELTILPRVGETLARAIVQFREYTTRSSPEGDQASAFMYPGDLQAVRGIGPKTVQRIAPYLGLQIAD